MTERGCMNCGRSLADHTNAEPFTCPAFTAAPEHHRDCNIYYDAAAGAFRHGDRCTCGVGRKHSEQPSKAEGR